MKKCRNCGNILSDTDLICPKCRVRQSVSSSTQRMVCSKCGKPVASGNAFCPSCGSPVRSSSLGKTNAQTSNTTITKTPEIVKKLINGIKATSILWIVVGGLQLLCGIILALCILVDSSLSNYAIATLEYFVIGSINIVIGIVNIQSTKKLKRTFKGITEKYSFKKAIGMYIWNGIIFVSLILSLGSGGCISLTFAGLILSIFIVDLVTIRLHVKNNRKKFKKLESVAVEIDDEDDEDDDDE